MRKKVGLAMMNPELGCVFEYLLTAIIWTTPMRSSLEEKTAP